MRLTPGWRLAALCGLVVFTGLIWRPAVIFALGSAMAAVFGCEMSERGPAPCLVGGGDVGPHLYRAYVEGGWGMVGAMPLMIATAAVWTRVIIRWHRQRHQLPMQ